LDDLPVESVQRFESELYRFVDNAHPGVLAQIREKKALDDALKNELKNVLKEFKDRFTSELNRNQAASQGAATR
jgi:F-type H+-transporting ATPase subunit alpha